MWNTADLLKAHEAADKTADMIEKRQRKEAESKRNRFFARSPITRQSLLCADFAVQDLVKKLEANQLSFFVEPYQMELRAAVEPEPMLHSDSVRF